MSGKKWKYQERLTLGYDGSGKRIRVRIYADSKQELERKKYEARKEYELIRNPSQVTLGAYAKKWFEVFKSNLREQTKKGYQDAIKKLDPIGMIPIRNVTALDLQGIINQHADHPRSCQLLKGTLVQIYAQAITDGIIYPVNLASKLELPKYVCKERRFITDDEMGIIMNIDFRPSDKLFVNILKNTGMRPAEAMALQWSDIGDREITVRRSFEFKDNYWPVVKETKTAVIRTIPVSADFVSELRQLPKESLFIFIRKNGQPWTKTTYKRTADRILAAVNRAFGGNSSIDVLNGLTLYSFRHTYATNLYYHGVKTGIISTKKAAQIMGHSEEMFIKRYTHLDDSKEQLEALVNALNGGKNKPEEGAV